VQEDDIEIALFEPIANGGEDDEEENNVDMNKVRVTINRPRNGTELVDALVGEIDEIGT